MSEQELLFSFLIGLSTVSLVAVGMSVLQWRRINYEAKIADSLRRLRGKKLPTMTVLVYARNQQDRIEQTLRTLRNNRYRSYDIVVIDDASDDATATVVRAFCARYSSATVRLLRRRKQTSVEGALRAGYRKSKKGSIVLVVTPDLTLDARVMKRTAAAQSTKGVWRIAVHERLGDTFHLGDIGTLLENYFWQVGPYARAYSKAMFLERHAALPAGIRGDTDTRGALGVLLAVGIIAGTVTLLGVQAFWYAWLVVTAYGLMVVWVRYGETLRDRLILTLSIPLALFLIPATSIVRGISQLSSRK